MDEIDRKIESAVAKGTGKVYDQFQSDMILYDRGDGMGNAYGRKVLWTIIVPFSVGLPLLVLSYGLQSVTGMNEATAFWVTVIGFFVFLFLIWPVVAIRQIRVKSLIDVNAKAEAWKEQQRKANIHDLDEAAAQYVKDVKSIEIS